MWLRYGINVCEIAVVEHGDVTGIRGAKLVDESIPVLGYRLLSIVCPELALDI